MQNRNVILEFCWLIKGKASLLSRDGAKQVKYLIICLAFVHIFSSLLTYSLGIAKVTNFLSFSLLQTNKNTNFQFSLFNFTLSYFKENSTLMCDQ